MLRDTPLLFPKHDSRSSPTFEVSVRSSCCCPYAGFLRLRRRNRKNFNMESPLLNEIQARMFILQPPALLVAALCAYLASTWIYNLFFHPLAGFPGPKRAAVSRLYEFYYDVIKRGQYVYKIEEMHRKYGAFSNPWPGLSLNFVSRALGQKTHLTFVLSLGPIIRISPYEIVINDPDFYNELYVSANTRRTTIWPRYRTGIGFDGTSLAYSDFP